MQGGKRIGAGRKSRNYEVKQMGMRVPKDIFEDCVKACEKLTEKYEKSLCNQK